MSDIVKRTEHLPADFGSNLMAGIDQTRASIVGAGGGKPFLRLLRDGDYVYGPQSIQAQEGAHWAVNLASLQHGWVCWGDGELLGQVMGSVQAPKPARPPALEGYQFEAQYGFELACISGEDVGIVVDYKNNSLGYRKAFDQLLADIRTRYVADQQFYWPVITLDTSSYAHKKYGKIYEPVFSIVGWADADGNLQTAKPRPVAAPPAEAAPAPARARRAPARPVDAPAEAPAPEAPAAAPANEAPPLSTTQTRVGQRRRPAAN